MSDDRRAFVAWARAHAVPLATCEPGSGTADLEALLGVLSGRRVVGLGEATHGTREFFQLKHRLVELLTEHAVFTQFQIEANRPDALAVQEYVEHGIGRADETLAGMYFWVWDTEEVLALIEWLRGRGGVRFSGFDLQFAPTAARRLIGLGEPASRVAARRALEPVLDPTLAEHWRFLQTESRESALAAAATLAESAPAARLEQARQLSRFLADWSEFLLRPDIWAQREARDRSMAANVLDVLGGGRAVLWAHNQHVGRDGFCGRFPSMGGHLHAKLGTDYGVVGFAFGHGGFRSGKGQSGPSDIVVDAPPPGSLEEALAEVGLPRFALTWDDLDPAARRWLATKPRTRSIGSGYSGDDTSTLELDPSEQYDVLIYVDATTAARPNATALRPPVAEAPREVTPVNLDLADLDPDGRPRGWFRSDARVAAGYDVAVVGGGLQVTRREPRWPHGAVTVYQVLRRSAGPCTVRAQLRRQGDLDGGSARLLLAWAGEESGRRVAISPAAAPDGMWTDVSATIDVLDDGGELRVGVAVAGSSPAYARRIEVSSAPR